MKRKWSICLLLWLAGFCVNAEAYTLIDRQNHPSDDLMQLFQTLSIPMENDPAAINDYMQTHFLRKSTEERWEMSPSIYESHWEEILPIFQRLGMADPIPPSQSHYHYVILNGQNIPGMQKQIEYLLNLWNRGDLTFDHVVFLTGQRPLAIVDGNDSLFSQAATESEAAQILSETYLTPKGISWEIIAAPMHSASGKRPTTEDTIQAWLESSPRPDSVLMISINPFIPYQFETFHNNLARAGWFSRGGTLEGCGDSLLAHYRGNNRLAILLDNLARIFYTEMHRQNF